jgi:xylulokinase
MSRFVMGLDIGTGSVKCVAVSCDGLHCWTSCSSYRYTSPHPGWAEQDPKTWWEASAIAIRQLIAEHPEVRDSLDAIAVCGQGAAAVLLDEKMQPTRPAMLWLDSRAASEAQLLNERFGFEIAGKSGKLPAAYNVEPKLRWVAKHEPVVWNSTRSFLTATAYIAYRLCGQVVTNHSDAGILLSYHLRTRSWSQDLAEWMKIPADWYSPLADCEQVIGEVTADAASECGLVAGTAVLAGGEDTSCAALAAGVVLPGQAILSLGNAGTLYAPCTEAVTHPRLLAFPHVIKGMTLLGGSTVCGGSGLEWIARILRGDQGPSAVQSLCEQAADVSTHENRLVFLPYLSGELQPINDGFARGVFFGLDFSTSQAEIAAAVMQGTAFAFAQNLELIREAGAAPSRLLATGAPARNRQFIQTISNATSLPIDVIEEGGGAALGSALLAARATQPAKTAQLLSESHRQTVFSTYPDTARQPTIAPLFSIYKELYGRLQDLFPRLQQQTPLRSMSEVV